MNTQKEPLQIAPDVKKILKEDRSFFTAAAVTWAGIITFVVAVLALSYFRFPLISSIGVLMLLGLAFWAMGRRSRARFQTGANDLPGVQPGLRTHKLGSNVTHLQDRRLK